MRGPLQVNVQRGGPADLDDRDMVLTPGGLRPRSAVQAVPPGVVVDGASGWLRVRHPSGDVLGEAPFPPVPVFDRPAMPDGIVHPRVRTTRHGIGWIVYASWANRTGTPISSLTTRWTVPAPPATTSGQTIFLFNGIQSSTMICQPVLRWGQSANGGGDEWTVACWYAGGGASAAFHSVPVPVAPGQTLVGTVTGGRSDDGDGFTYDCAFEGIPDAHLPVEHVPELTHCVHTLESYHVTQCSDYPDAASTSMSAIEILTAGDHPAMRWSMTRRVTDCHQRVVIVDDSSSGGQVDIYY